MSIKQNLNFSLNEITNSKLGIDAKEIKTKITSIS